MAYSEKVVDHYNNPRNVGSMPKEDPNVGTGLVGAPECGDVMKLQMKINPDTKVIEEAKFKTFGCGSAIASSSGAIPALICFRTSTNGMTACGRGPGRKRILPLRHRSIGRSSYWSLAIVRIAFLGRPAETSRSCRLSNLD